MKILAIRCKNLASLEGETEIDFTQEPLKSAGIFAITGPTGAGKSTILDALCLALYAKTPRYLQAKEMGIEVQDVAGTTIGQGDIRGILRDGTAEGFAEVEFLGIDGDTYRATWHIRRARNKAEGSLQAYTLSLYNVSTQTDVPGKKTELLPEIERLVGLNFEQFTRSVLLAQGDFTAFLKAPKDEKSSLLEKLTGTYIYSEISKQIFEKHRTEAQELRELNQKREGVATCTPEELAELIQQKNDFEQALPAQEKQVETLTKAIQWHTQLAQYQSHLVAAQEMLEGATASKTNAAQREENLKRVLRVQSARSLVDGKRLTENQNAHSDLVLQKIILDLADLQIERESHEKLVVAADQDAALKTTALAQAKPLLEAAKVLDVQIAEKLTQVKQAAIAHTTALENQKQQADTLKTKQIDADKLQESIAKLKLWKEENSPRKEVAENQSLIVSKLKDAENQLFQLKEITDKTEVATASFDNLAKEKTNLEQAATTTEKALDALRLVHSNLIKALDDVDVSALQNEKTTIDTALADLIPAEAHWRILWSKTTDFTTLHLRLEKNQTEIKGSQQGLQQATSQTQILKSQHETALALLQKARLAAAENVETLRQQLVDGASCPVCGSLEHPYAQHNPQLDFVLSEIETEQRKSEIAYNEGIKNQTKLESSLAQLEKIIVEQEAEAAALKSELQDLQGVWTNFAAHAACNQMPDFEKTNWLNQQIANKKAQQKIVEDKLKTHTLEKQNADNKQLEIRKLEEQYNITNNKLKDTNRTLQSLQEQFGQFTSAQSKLHIELKTTEALLTPYFSSADWFEQWQKEPKKFVDHLNAFATNWKTNTQKLDVETSQHSIALESLSAMMHQLKMLQNELQNKETALAALNQQLAQHTEKRKSIFDGEAVQTIELRLQNAIDAALKTLDLHKAQQQNLLTTRTKLETQKDQTEKEIANQLEQLQTQTKKLTTWLANDQTKNGSALTEADVTELLSQTPEWIETEQSFLKAIEVAITQANSVCTERKETLANHLKQRSSEQHPNVLQELLAEAKEIVKTTTEEKSKMQLLLDQDVANKKAIGSLLNTINAKAQVVENWAKLNDIIGSADGKKFRQIAQEYTLDILLSYANVHLEILSKRYLLQRIPDTLGLQVIDQDMGNDIRTVFSLSGGESFLVSLALALGLASLSSARMQVESLFIDEGFGSLDMATLNIAMDALERLHNQGRKVGVISHVQEMTERIPVQIKVTKENSGRSKVEIIA